MKIKDIKQLVNSLPDEVEISIEIEKLYPPDKYDFSVENIKDFRLVGRTLVLECKTVI